MQEQCAALGLSHCLLLTGPAILHPFRQDELDTLKTIGESVLEVPICPERLSPDYWPSVVELDLDHPTAAGMCRHALERAVDDWSPNALGEGRGHRIGAFLFTAERTDSIVRHLSDVFVQQRADGQGQRLLALGDPAAFEGIWQVCDEAQRRFLLGPVALWRTLGRWGEWIDYGVPDGGRADDERAPFPHFDDRQWTALFDVRPINRAWARMRAGGHAVQPGDFAKLPEMLARARAYGLSDPEDLELFAAHALESGADFDLHPIVQRVLHNRPADTYYSLAVADLTEADWAELREARPNGRTNQ
ncbi:MAG: hypothetical protein LBJ65_20550 [Burkholderia sp.]|uniref:hypothetical protein n=1 Tax=Burkholderia sp. TaxID=36773 RepID=UPI002837916E|nr:hypothetical protein [Burkholderia sp.]MDR0243993.1 hypothetical protein [Burkholderia sp.]